MSGVDAASTMSTMDEVGSLALPSKARDEFEVLQELQEGPLFVDESFAPAGAAIVGAQAVAEGTAPAIGWNRMAEKWPNASLFIDGALPGDLHTECLDGTLDVAWFAGALATVATRADLLLRLFESVDNEEHGMLSLRFFKHAAWRTVLIDTMVPCTSDGKPAFCRATSELELWPTVLLKGYAKMHGSYARLDAGDAGEALVDLTGGALTRERMPALLQNDEDEQVLERLWQSMRDTEREGGLLAMEVGAGEGGDGLLAGRLYPVLECYEDEGVKLLRMRNPWGGDGWEGAFGHESEELHAMASQLARDDAGAAFWMQLEDAVQVFKLLYAVRIFSDGWQAMGCEGAWRAESAGGAPSEPSWCDNPQFWLSLSGPGAPTATMYAVLSQRDGRIEVPTVTGEEGGEGPADDAAAADGTDEGGGQSYLPVSLSLLQGGAASSKAYGRIWQRTRRNVVLDGRPARRREVLIRAVLQRGVAYCVVPSCMSKSKAPFCLRFFCDAPFELQQAPPSRHAACDGAWDSSSAGGPGQSPTWNLNPQFWLTLRPPPGNKTMSHIRATLRIADGDGDGDRAAAAAANTAVSLCLMRGYMYREKVYKVRPGSAIGGGSGYGGQASPPERRPGSAPSPPTRRPGSSGGGGGFGGGGFGSGGDDGDVGGFGIGSGLSPHGARAPNQPGATGLPPGATGGRPTSAAHNRAVCKGRPTSATAAAALAARPGGVGGVDGSATGMPASGTQLGACFMGGGSGLPPAGPMAGSGMGGSAVLGSRPTSAYRGGSAGGGRPGTSSGGRGARASTAPAKDANAALGMLVPSNGSTLGGSAMIAPGEGGAEGGGGAPVSTAVPFAEGSIMLEREAVGPYVLAKGVNVRDTSTLTPVRTHAPESVLCETALSEGSTTMHIELDPGAPYLFCCSTQMAKQMARFKLEISSDSLVDLTPIAPSRQRVLRGAWRKETCGGSHMEGKNWSANPQFALRLAEPGEVKIVLKRPHRAWRAQVQDFSMEAMQAIYVLAGKPNGEPIRGVARQGGTVKVISQTAYVPFNEVSTTMRLSPQPDGAPFLIMPTTFSPGMKGPFSLGVSADVDFELVALPDPSTALKVTGPSLNKFSARPPPSMVKKMKPHQSVAAAAPAAAAADA